jgi:TRAP transporter 4TM/12TM fusion protein
VVTDGKEEDPRAELPEWPAPAVSIGFLVRILAIGFAAFAILEVNLLRLQPFQQRAVFLALPLALAFLIPKRGTTSPRALPWQVIDYVLAALSIISCGYIVVNLDGLMQRMGTPTTMDLVMGSIGTILVVVATQRLVGWALPIITTTFIVYAFAGDALPTALGGHNGYSFGRIITQSFLSIEGVFGIPLAVMFNYVFPFVLFGIVLEAVGGLGFAIDLAQALLGRFRGGPSKVAVVSSAVFGMVNGSAVANVVTAGSFTIPMMKKTGVQPHVAAAVEAVASTGGQLMPPVMGAAAFVMAEYLGIPYLQIVVAALIPALLFYLALFATIHFYAVRHNIGGISMEARGALVFSLLRRRELFLFTVPVACLIWFLFSGYSPTRSASYAIAGAFLISLFVKQYRLTPKRILQVLEKAGRDAITLCCAVGCVGIVIGLVLMTALATRFAPMIIDLSGGNRYLALVLVMVSSIVLGMGLPTIICYVLLANLVAGALVDMDFLPLAAHMFILYFGMMSMVTPPSALAAYAGATIAGADIMKTAFTAWMFSLSGYLLPFMFALNPALLMQGPATTIVMAAATGAIGMIALGGAVAGHIRIGVGTLERIALFMAAALLIHVGLITDVMGLALLTPSIFKHYNPLDRAAT